MALLFVEGFGQFQGQLGSQLLSSLTTAGYQVSQGVALAAGRHADSFALELQVSAGAAGLSWSSRVNGVKSHLRSIASGAGRWVAVGDNGVIYTSTDTITWAPCANSSTLPLLSVAYGNGLWVAVGGTGGSAVILTSSDGMSWTLRAAPAAADLKGVAYGGGRWCAVGINSGASVVFASDDGVAWGIATVTGTSQLNAVIHHSDFGWVAVGNQGTVRRSADGLTWSSGTYGATGNISSLAYDGTRIVAVAGGAFRSSTDGGATWAGGALVSGESFNGLAYASDLWVAVGTQGAIFTSTDRLTWTERPTALNNGSFYGVAVSSGLQVAWLAVGQVTGQGTNSMAAIYASMAPPTTVSRTFVSSASRVVLGFAHRATARGRIARIANVCDIDWPAGIEILGQQGNAVPIRNAWYYYELTIDKTAQTISLHINDTADITVPMPSSVAGVTEYAVTWEVENGAVGRINDIYFLDNTTTGGSTLVNRLKPIRVPIRFPTADVLSEWDSTEPGDHWQVVGLPPPDNEKYLYSAVSGAQELFTSDESLPVGAGTPEMPIIAVGIVALASKSDLDNRQLGLVVGEVGTQLEVVDSAMSIDPKYSYAVFEKAPGNVAWDDTNVLATPFGVVVRP